MWVVAWRGEILQGSAPHGGGCSEAVGGDTGGLRHGLSVPAGSGGCGQGGCGRGERALSAGVPGAGGGGGAQVQRTRSRGLRAEGTVSLLRRRGGGHVAAAESRGVSAGAGGSGGY